MLFKGLNQRKMKRIALVLAVASIGFANAQNPEMATSSQPRMRHEKELTPEQKAKRNADKAEKSLGLNSDQKSKWEVAAKERIIANASLKEKSKASSSESDKKALRDQMRLNNEKFDQAVVAFLTAEQKTKWDQLKQERIQHHKNKMQKPEN